MDYFHLNFLLNISRKKEILLKKTINILNGKEEYFKSSVIWNMALSAMYIENKVKIIIFLSKIFFD